MLSQPLEYLGIDPGKNGGIARLCVVGDRVVSARAWSMPEDDFDLWALLEHLSHSAWMIAVEDVHSMPRDGSKSAHAFGRQVGRLHMAITATGHKDKVVMVSPISWQNALGCRTGGDKRVTYDRAGQEFGEQFGVRVTHKVADALLIGLWAAKFGAQHDAKKQKVKRSRKRA